MTPGAVTPSRVPPPGVSRPGAGRHSRRRRGVIMMEAVIAMPLLLLLLGGIFWIGQLSYARQRLIVADRFVAWNSGNWHTPGSTVQKGEVQDRFFRGDTFDQITTVGVAREPGHWWQVTYGEANVESTMPPWTRGHLMAASIMNRRRFLMQERTSPYYGRLSLDGAKAGGHSVVTRRAADPGDTRTDTPGVDTDRLGINYEGITEEPYPAK